MQVNVPTPNHFVLYGLVKKISTPFKCFLRKSQHQLNVSSVLSPLPSSLYCLTLTKTTVQKTDKGKVGSALHILV